MARELEDHRSSIRRIETRLRDMEEAMKLIAQELRHNGEMDVLERDRLLAKLETELATFKTLPSAKPKKRRNR
jgi:predicted  nucleic acid-binding Zn-ribbon protein